MVIGNKQTPQRVSITGPPKMKINNTTRTRKKNKIPQPPVAHTTHNHRHNLAAKVPAAKISNQQGKSRQHSTPKPHQNFSAYLIRHSRGFQHQQLVD